MEDLGLTEAEIHDVLGLVAAVLKLGAIRSVSDSYYSSGNSVQWIGTSSISANFSSTNSPSGTTYTFSASVTFSAAQ